MDITPERLLAEFKDVLAQNHFLRLQVAELEQRLDAASPRSAAVPEQGAGAVAG